MWWEKMRYLLFMRRTSIRQQIFRRIIFGSMVTFVAMGLLYLYGLYAMSDSFDEQSDELGETASGYTSNVTSMQIQERLVDVARSRAGAIETELMVIGRDTEYLAKSVQRILQNKQLYTPRTLPNPLEQPIKSGQTYVHYGKNLQQHGISPAVAEEVGLVSNLADFVLLMNAYYQQYESSLFIGSRNGYIIATDNAPGQQYIPMTEDFLKTYEPTERGWYVNTHHRDTLTFNDIYVGAEGYPSFTCSAPYEDEQGFAGVAAIACSVGSVSRIVESAVIGKSGVSFVLSEAGKIMLSTKKEGILSASAAVDLSQSGNEELALAVENMIAGKTGWQLVEIDGEEYYLAYAPLTRLHWSFGALIAKQEVLIPAVEAKNYVAAQMNNFRNHMYAQTGQLCLIALVVLLLIIGLMLAVSVRLTERFIKPIQELTEGVREIASGNLQKKLQIRTGDEIEHLATCFNAMTDELQKHIDNLTQVTAERERIATELTVAAKIQESMLPKTTVPFAERQEFSLYAAMTPAKEVGGDYYDFYMLDKRRLMLLIADVSGKGVPAAFFMAIAKNVMKNVATMMEDKDDLAALAAQVNDHLCEHNDAMMFVTAFICVLDVETGHLTYVNAGHNPPLIYRRQEKAFQYMQVKHNFVLGGMEELDFASQELMLTPGDKLFLYTDGVSEALNEEKELFGEERLLATLNRGAQDGKENVQTFIQHTKEELSRYVGSAEQSDDITMMMLAYNGQVKA